MGPQWYFLGKNEDINWNIKPPPQKKLSQLTWNALFNSVFIIIVFLVVWFHHLDAEIWRTEGDKICLGLGWMRANSTNTSQIFLRWNELPINNINDNFWKNPVIDTTYIQRYGWKHPIFGPNDNIAIIVVKVWGRQGLHYIAGGQAFFSILF